MRQTHAVLTCRQDKFVPYRKESSCDELWAGTLLRRGGGAGGSRAKITPDKLTGLLLHLELDNDLLRQAENVANNINTKKVFSKIILKLAVHGRILTLIRIK